MKRITIGEGFLWRWVVANFAAVLLGILAVLPVAVNLARTEQAAWLVGAIGGAVLGLALGVGQWWVLRRALSSTGLWIILSIVGATIGLALGMQVAEGLSPLAAVRTVTRGEATLLATNAALTAVVTGLCFGLLLGACQWFLLRQQVSDSGWWIVVNVLGWAVGFGLAALVVDGLGVIGWLVSAGVVNGLGTGWLLTWLAARDSRRQG